jgi:flagellar biosynthesis protein FliQ
VTLWLSVCLFKHEDNVTFTLQYTYRLCVSDAVFVVGVLCALFLAVDKIALRMLLLIFFILCKIVCSYVFTGPYLLRAVSKLSSPTTAVFELLKNVRV